MITAYHRPESLDEAVRLVARKTPLTYPLGGGTLLSHGSLDEIEVVDLQALGLNRLEKAGNLLKMGATSALQQILEHKECPAALREAIKLEAPLNLRNAATAAGTIVSCDGRSTFTTALLALDTQVDLRNPSAQAVSLGDFLALRGKMIPGALITDLQVPLIAKLAFEFVSRTPADKPIVCVALALWPSGRSRLAVGGCGASPLLAMDGTEASGVEKAARNAFHDSTDPWGSAEYRMDAAATLARRCLENLAAV